MNPWYERLLKGIDQLELGTFSLTLKFYFIRQMGYQAELSLVK